MSTKKINSVVKQNTHLGKSAHFFTSVDEMERQFDNDVKVMTKQFQKVTDCFDLRNPWDESVMGFIVTDIIGFMLANADRGGINLEGTMKQAIMDRRETYRKAFAEKDK